MTRRDDRGAHASPLKGDAARRRNEFLALSSEQRRKIADDFSEARQQRLKDRVRQSPR
jgi:hypothetical protein